MTLGTVLRIRKAHTPAPILMVRGSKINKEPTLEWISKGSKVIRIELGTVTARKQ
jgi:hypothetical protein